MPPAKARLSTDGLGRISITRLARATERAISMTAANRAPTLKARQEFIARHRANAEASRAYALGKCCSIAVITACDVGRVTVENQPTKRPSGAIRYLWKFHFGVASAPTCWAAQR